MTHRSRLALALSLVALPLFAEGETASREERIAMRIQEWLDQEMSRFREEVLRSIRKELVPRSTVAPASAASFEEALSSIRADEAFEHNVWLADDARAGRESGTPGCEAAAEYIAERFEAYGLTPIGDDGTYFQRFTFGRTKKVETCNVVAMREGTDRNDEYVVIGAHYDHVGKGKMTFFNGRMGGSKSDDIYNGADDNASGISGLIEIAQAFSRLAPSRSVIFIAFAGEEKGLLGSYHYTAHPIKPLEKTVAMINMDMIGRNPKKAVQVLGAKTSPQLEAIARRAAEMTEVKATFPTGGVFGGSDHYPFYQKGVPVLFFFTGFHKDYHRASDHADAISKEQIERVSRMAAVCLWEVANTDEEIEYKKLPGGGIGMGRRPRLGVMPAELDPEQAQELGVEEGRTGILIQDVVEGSAAEKGGIRKGDVVLSFDGKSFSADDGEGEFREAVARAKGGVDIAVVVLRDGERITLTVRLK